MTSHPVQYQAPLFRELAANEAIDLTVFYGHDGSIVGEIDRDFGLPVRWDRPLLDGYRHVFLDRRAEGRNTLQRLAAESRVVAHLWSGRFDAVFIHSYATPLSLFAYVGAVISRTPILLRTESHDLAPRPAPLELLKSVALRLIFRVTSGFLVIGTANRRFFERRGVASTRLFSTPYSVDNAFFTAELERVRASRGDLRGRFGWTDDIVVVGCSGKLIARKGVEDLVDAVARLQADGLRIGLLLIGDGPYREALANRVRTHGMQWTVFAGFRNQSELAACYVCLDAFVLPSRFETWGLVLNEAMVFGLPVVAAHTVGAAVDLIEPDGNGYVYAAGNVDALAEALRRLVTSVATRERLGKRSKAIVRDFSYAACVRGIVDGIRAVSRRPGYGE